MGSNRNATVWKHLHRLAVVMAPGVGQRGVSRSWLNFRSFAPTWDHYRGISAQFKTTLFIIWGRRAETRFLNSQVLPRPPICVNIAVTRAQRASSTQRVISADIIRTANLQLPCSYDQTAVIKFPQNQNRMCARDQKAWCGETHGHLPPQTTRGGP